MNQGAIQITKLTKDRGRLSKRIHLKADGTVGIDSAACWIAKGKMERLPVTDLGELATIIESTPANVAFALGRMKYELGESAHLVTKADPLAGKPGYATRTVGTITYEEGQPAVALIDFDTKGMTDDVKARLKQAGGFAKALQSVMPDFATAGYVRRKSTSANVINTATGERQESSGQHIYLSVQDGADVQRFLSP